jgi:hypothetical protein
VGGEGVRVLEVLGDIGGVESTVGARVGTDDQLLLGRVDRDDRAAHAVVDCAQPIVAASDDAIADGELLASDVDALTEATFAPKLGARQRVETPAADVVARDEDSLPARTRNLMLTPGRDRRSLRRGSRLGVPREDVHLRAGCPLGEVVAGVAAAHMGQQRALARVALTHDLAQLIGAQAPAERSQPAAGLDA